MRGTGDGQGFSGHSHFGEIHTVRQCPRQLVKYSPADLAVVLQALNDAHALDQLLAAFLEIIDLRDPLIDHGDLPADVIVTGDLPVDGTADGLVGNQHRTHRTRHSGHQDQQEAFAADFTPLLAPG
ncbi:hypothetical protein D9M70_600980 [compost metagenome]